MESIKRFFNELGREIFDVSYTLFKVMIPVIVIVKLLEELGGTALLSQWLAPLMSMVGLPEEMGLVWATTILTNIYAGMLVFVQTDFATPLSVAQVSVIGALMLMAHGLPVEVAIAKRAGVGVAATLALRLGGGFLFAWLLHLSYSTGDLLQQPAQLLWQPEVSTETGWLAWVVEQVKSLLAIQVIIALLLFGLKLLKILGVERLMGLMLRPVLKLLGISREATSITIIGVTLGLAFGGGLLINEARRGQVSARDVFTAIMLLNLLHSMIEDTLLILLLGADFTSIFWARIGFACVIVMLISRGLRLLSESTCQRYLYRSVALK